jgi:hypothetical protein
MLQHLVSSRSDHSPVLLKLVEDNNRPGRQRSMRYEIMWEREALLSTEILEAWNKRSNNRNLGDISQVLRGVMHDLRAWSMIKFGSVLKELKKLREQLEDLRRAGVTEDSMLIKEKMNRMDEILYREEMM